MKVNNTAIYALQIDWMIYTCSPKTGLPYTLVTAMQEARGCGNTKIVKAVNGGGWKTVVLNAGSDTEVQHAATGRKLRRRYIRDTRKIAGTWAAFLYGSVKRKQEFLAELERDVEAAKAQLEADKGELMTYAEIKAATRG